MWGLAPSEFWGMSPQEFWLLADAKRPTERIGNLDADAFEELRAMLEEPTR